MLGSWCLSTDDSQEGCVAAHLFSVGIDLKELGGQLPKYLKFCPGIEIQSHFRPKMSVCRHELGGGFNPQPPTIPTLHLFLHMSHLPAPLVVISGNISEEITRGSISSVSFWFKSPFFAIQVCCTLFQQVECRSLNCKCSTWNAAVIIIIIITPTISNAP